MKNYLKKHIGWALGIGGLLLPLAVFGATVLGDAQNVVELGNNLSGRGFRVTNISNLSVGTSTVNGAVNVVGDINIAGGIRLAGNIHSATGVVQFLNGSNAIPIKSGGLVVSGSYASNAPAYGAYIQGNVGIGTTNPASKLHLEKNGDPALIIANTNTANGQTSSIHFWTYAGTGDPRGRAIISASKVASGDSGDLKFTVRNNGYLIDALYLKSDGNVGIGTTNPLTGLVLNRGSALIQTSHDAITSPINWNSLTSPSEGLFLSYDATNNRARIVAIETATAYRDLTIAGANVYLNSGSSSQTTAMKIDASQNVGIGTTNPNHKLDIVGAYYSRQVNKGSVSSVVAINWNDGNMQHVTLTSSTTFTFTGGQGGARYVLAVKQGGTGGRKITWPANVRWPGGVPFTLTETAGKTDYIGLIYNNVDGTYDGVAFSANF